MLRPRSGAESEGLIAQALPGRGGVCVLAVAPRVFGPCGSVRVDYGSYVGWPYRLHGFLQCLGQK